MQQINETAAIDASRARSATGRRWRAYVLRAGFGVAVVGFLLWRYDARPILRLIVREHPLYFAATWALYVAGQVMSAYRWQLVAAPLKVRAPFRKFFAFYFVGMFTNLFIPGLVGGDAARAIYLGRQSHRFAESVTSVVADRAIGMIALVWFAAAAVWLLNDSTLPASVATPVEMIGALGFLGFAVGPLLARLIRRMPRPLRRAALLVRPLLVRPFGMAPAAMLSLVLQASLAVCQYLLSAGLGMDLPLTLFLLCVPIANTFASLPLTLNGLGFREGAYIVLFGMAGVAGTDAIALGLLWFAATTLGNLTGAVAFAATEFPTGLVPSTEDTERGGPTVAT